MTNKPDVIKAALSVGKCDPLKIAQKEMDTAIAKFVTSDTQQLKLL